MAATVDRQDTSDLPRHTNTGMVELDSAECWRLFRTQQVGRLAVSIANFPDIFPINYVVDGETIVFRTSAGTKLAAAVLGRGTAFEIDGYDPVAGEAWSVVLKGEAREIEHMGEYFDAQELPLFPWHASPKPDFVRLEPREVTGRRFHVVAKQALAASHPAPEHSETGHSETGHSETGHTPPEHGRPYTAPD